VSECGVEEMKNRFCKVVALGLGLVGHMHKLVVVILILVSSGTVLWCVLAIEVVKGDKFGSSQPRVSRQLFHTSAMIMSYPTDAWFLSPTRCSYNSSFVISRSKSCAWGFG
jgi:hypothetical protein